ncbi:nucleoside-diphosphate-sugar epimerase [Amycolatopsis bartoniae]|uniref:Oxidoreductase n=1 Tax=Amycolatopsis bartoniae TaxID=941986 RepID=A0A8H9J5C6_9PSEU|nr:NAD-dependent epimerase/dehydratase family protein [Amycolatopsis bartoniae]MBB2938699.1 nucleoside-diphosphate-sugar epimerase [Amycolatopsis bartoniae]TVT11515.1 NAD-dependent epimerase/dehydratase family protein [Amycolatopsis bartoniae]GHF79517.1 oxidoreductase [Amycolatopsis bartoniae]
MHVFITGATGWIGSAAVDHLLDAGHEVTGLARSEASAAALAAKGARARRGDLDDLDGLRAGADGADAVVHLANKHDWAHPAETNRTERDAVRAIAEALAGSHRPFVLAAGLHSLAPGKVATEQDPSPFHGVESVRGGSENLALEFVAQGVNTVVVRFAPTVHGKGDNGFLAGLVAVARAKGESAYLGDGTHRWAAIHRDDAGRVVRLALDRKAPARTILHATAEPGVPTRDIATAIGRAFDLPVVAVPQERAGEHFGWLNRFFGTDMAASSEATRTLLGWTPGGPSLADDLKDGAYA